MAEMKFYQGHLPRIIWDKDVGAPAAHFDRHGFFKTGDEKIQKLLIGKGYLTEKDMEDLRKFGTSPHGGFQKVVDDSKLPSGKPPIEDDALREKLGGMNGKRIVREQIEIIDPGEAIPDGPAVDGTSEEVDEAELVQKRKRLKRSKSSS